MRISHGALDGEIQRNIDTCLRELARVGINVKMEDPLLDKACELFCKAEFNYQGKGGEFRKNYEMLRDAMSLTGRYREAAGEDV